MELLTKKECRLIAKERIKSLTEQEKLLSSVRICNDIITSGLLDNHDNIMLYKALPTEVNVDILIQYCIAKGKKVFLPRVNGDKLDIVEYGQGFSLGAYGIEEPIGANVDVPLDVAVLPLLGVDKRGVRLGKGKGYYDRLLSGNNALKIAVAFKAQVFEELPSEKHDIKSDIVFTA